MDDISTIINPDHEVFKKWIEPQISNSDSLEIVYKDDVLSMKNKKNDDIWMHHKNIPITKFFPDIKAIDFILPVEISSDNISPRDFSPQIIFHGRFRWICDKGNGVMEKMTLVNRGRKKFVVYFSPLIQSCKLLNITHIKNNEVIKEPGIKLINVDAPDLEIITLCGRKIFDLTWQNIRDFINWDKPFTPFNFSTRKSVTLYNPTFGKLTYFLTGGSLYSYKGIINFTLNTSTKNISKILFPACKFPRLRQINLTDEVCTLRIDIENDQCYMFYNKLKK